MVDGWIGAYKQNHSGVYWDGGVVMFMQAQIAVVSSDFSSFVWGMCKG